MLKKVIKKIRIKNILGGNANPSPPIGPILGGVGVNIMNFCNEFNKITKNNQGVLSPVSITVYEDKSFDFIVHKPPVSFQLLEILKLKKGSKEPNRQKIGKIKINDIKEIAKIKIIDMNCRSLSSATNMIIGTAKSLGIEIDYNL